MSLVDTPLFGVPKGKAAKEIAKLHDRRRELLHQQRQALTSRDTARSQHERLSEQLRAAEALSVAFDQPASTKRDQTRLAKLADEVADRDHRATVLGSAIVAIEQEIRKRASADYAELVTEAVADHEQARHQVNAALASLAAAHSRAREAYTAVQSLNANAGRTHVRMADVPRIEDIVRHGGLEPLINSNDLIAA